MGPHTRPFLLPSSINYFFCHHDQMLDRKQFKEEVYFISQLPEIKPIQEGKAWQQALFNDRSVGYLPAHISGD